MSKEKETIKLLYIYYPKTDYHINDNSIYHTKSNSLVTNPAPYKIKDTGENYAIVMNEIDMCYYSKINKESYVAHITPTIKIGFGTEEITTKEDK